MAEPQLPQAPAALLRAGRRAARPGPGRGEDQDRAATGPRADGRSTAGRRRRCAERHDVLELGPEAERPADAPHRPIRVSRCGRPRVADPNALRTAGRSANDEGADGHSVRVPGASTSRTPRKRVRRIAAAREQSSSTSPGYPAGRTVPCTVAGSPPYAATIRRANSKRLTASGPATCNGPWT